MALIDHLAVGERDDWSTGRLSETLCMLCVEHFVAVCRNADTASGDIRSGMEPIVDAKVWFHPQLRGKITHEAAGCCRAAIIAMTSNVSLSAHSLIKTKMQPIPT